jgi:hypothetical protein
MRGEFNRPGQARVDQDTLLFDAFFELVAEICLGLVELLIC